MQFRNKRKFNLCYMGNTWDAVGEYGQITKTTILLADLGTILDPEDYSSAPVPKIPER